MEFLTAIHHLCPPYLASSEKGLCTYLEHTRPQGLHTQPVLCSVMLKHIPKTASSPYLCSGRLPGIEPASCESQGWDRCGARVGTLEASLITGRLPWKAGAGRSWSLSHLQLCMQTAGMSLIQAAQSHSNLGKFLQVVPKETESCSQLPSS